MGIGTGFALLSVLGFLVLGPKRMQEALRHIAKVKAELQRSTHDIKSQLAAAIEGDASSRK